MDGIYVVTPTAVAVPAGCEGDPAEERLRVLETLKGLRVRSLVAPAPRWGLYPPRTGGDRMLVHVVRGLVQGDGCFTCGPVPSSAVAERRSFILAYLAARADPSAARLVRMLDSGSLPVRSAAFEVVASIESGRLDDWQALVLAMANAIVREQEELSPFVGPARLDALRVALRGLHLPDDARGRRLRRLYLEAAGSDSFLLRRAGCAGLQALVGPIRCSASPDHPSGATPDPADLARLREHLAADAPAEDGAHTRLGPPAW